MAVLHGPRGEDGVIGALARLADVACVGSGLASSAVCLDKTLTRDVLDARGIAQTRWLGVYPGDRVPTYDEAADRLGSTVLYIKPANLGSSIGISRVADVLGWDAAISHAASYDDTLIIEAGVEGRELSVSILGDRADGYEVSEVSRPGPMASSSTMPTSTGPGRPWRRCRPTQAALRERVRDSAPDVAAALRVDGLARVDVFLTEDGALLVNEVSTCGFTTRSTFPRMWAASGVAFPQVLDRLCHGCGPPRAVKSAHRHRHRARRILDPRAGGHRTDWRVISELTVAARIDPPVGRVWRYDRNWPDVAARADECTLLVAEGRRRLRRRCRRLRPHSRHRRQGGPGPSGVGQSAGPRSGHRSSIGRGGHGSPALRGGHRDG
jgi:D-alanine--D-alanine ligase